MSASSPSRRAVLGGLLLLSACVTSEVLPPRAPGPELDAPGRPLVVSAGNRELAMTQLDDPATRASLSALSRRVLDAIRAGAPGAAAADLQFPLQVEARRVATPSDLLHEVQSAPWTRPSAAADFELGGIYLVRSQALNGRPQVRRLVELRVVPAPGQLARAGGVRLWITAADPPRVTSIQTD